MALAATRADEARAILESQVFQDACESVVRKEVKKWLNNRSGPESRDVHWHVCQHSSEAIKRELRAIADESLMGGH